MFAAGNRGYLGAISSSVYGPLVWAWLTEVCTGRWLGTLLLLFHVQWWISSERRLLNISNLATQTEVSRLVLRPGVTKTRAMCCCVRWNSLKVEWPIASGCFALLVGRKCRICLFQRAQNCITRYLVCAKIRILLMHHDSYQLQNC